MMVTGTWEDTVLMLIFVSHSEERMGRQDWTDMGGAQEQFLTTHWSWLGDLKAADGDTSRALIELLLERYWKPVYCYLRRKGHANEEAKDLTQGFFHEVVLNRHLMERADPAKGSFRSLLLHALHQYLIDEKRRETAAKRIPRDRLASLDALDSFELPQVINELDPGESFNYAWKADLLERVLAQVKADYIDQGMETHWHIFRDRLLTPLLEDTPTPSLKQICERYGIGQQATASHMLTTVKRHFQAVLCDYVRQTVLNGHAADEELKEILEFLER